MVLFADNKYRYSLQWDAFSEEQIRAGQQADGETVNDDGKTETAVH